jgi:hypothetical protein
MKAPVSAWQFRGFMAHTRYRVLVWTIDENGRTVDSLLAAILASPGRPERPQAIKALDAWMKAADDPEEGTAAWGRRQRRACPASSDSEAEML